MTINILNDFIKPIQEGYDKKQPWNEKRFIPARSSSTGFMFRVGNKEGSVRSPNITTMANPCERSMLHELFGISSYKIPKSESAFGILGGAVFNEEIDRIIAADERFTIGNVVTSTQPYFKKAGKVTSWIPKGRQFSNVSTKQCKGFFGTYDYSFKNDDGNMEIIELKASLDSTMPTKARDSYMRQLAIYVTETKSEFGHLVYLPSDLDCLNTEDESTYAIFTISYEEALQILESIHELLETAIPKLMWKGNDTYPWGTPKWFYRIVKTSEPCDDKKCCGKIDEFHSQYVVNEDWTFSPR